MNNVQRNFFKFIFILAVWSFALIGLFKINNNNENISTASIIASQMYMKKIPLQRNLLEKEKWNLNNLEQTSTTSSSDRLLSFIQAVDSEVLVDNRTGY